jgi:hypothetical protein
MFFLLSTSEGAAKAAEQAEETAHHAPIIVQLVNHYLGQPMHDIQMKTTYKAWTWFFAKFGSTPKLRSVVRIRPRMRSPGTQSCSSSRASSAWV